MYRGRGNNLEQANNFRIVGRGFYVLQEEMADPLAQSFEIFLGESVTEKIGFPVNKLDQISCQRALVFLQAT